MRVAGRLTALAVAVAGLLGCSGGSDGVVARPFGPPATGVYLGVNLDWQADSPSAIAERLGSAPAVYVEFVEIPTSDWTAVDDAARQVVEVGGVLLVTLEPHGGLHLVTPEAAGAVAARMATYADAGVPTMVRFAHEMNGSWYAWSQDPDAYVAAYRLVAEAIRDEAPATALVWAPNYGGGYPFLDGPHAAVPGTTAFQRLDTDGDRRLTEADDPYAPYHPGDALVDWVAMSLYHWGSAYPWEENELPEAGKLEAQLRGRYDGEAGDERVVPDFYQSYAVGRGKPLAIVETAALYRPGAPGPSELDIKRAWWRQVLDPGLTARLPAIRLVNWFEWHKHEGEVGADVDWRVTGDRAVLDAFRRDLPAFLRFAPVPGLP